MKHDIKKAIFVAKKMFAQLIYDFQSLEGMPFTFPEVKTFIQGVTVGGHKISDHDKLKQQQLAWHKLIDLVEKNQFKLTPETACELEYIVAKDEALVPGVIRNGAFTVSSGDFTYYPPAAGTLLSLIKSVINKASDESTPICNRGYNLAVDFVYNQFHWEGNKRTGSLMMNGLFLSNGILPCSVPAKRLKEYNILLMDLYQFGKHEGVVDFYKQCHMDIYSDWEMEYPC